MRVTSQLDHLLPPPFPSSQRTMPSWTRTERAVNIFLVFPSSSSFYLPRPRRFSSPLLSVSREEHFSLVLIPACPLLPGPFLVVSGMERISWRLMVDCALPVISGMQRSSCFLLEDSVMVVRSRKWDMFVIFSRGESYAPRDCRNGVVF